jgi:hypothetical protein
MGALVRAGRGLRSELHTVRHRADTLRQRFDEYSAGIGLLLQGSALLIWLPDLGQDRDVDRGEAQEDIDSPDMAFRRVRPASQGDP